MQWQGKGTQKHYTHGADSDDLQKDANAVGAGSEVGVLVGSEDAGGDERFLGGVELWLGREGLGTTKKKTREFFFHFF